jgi:hypothetical protein
MVYTLVRVLTHIADDRKGVLIEMRNQGFIPILGLSIGLA